MGCICNSGPLHSDNFFECSFVTLKFSENEDDKIEYIRKKEVAGESLSSSPATFKTAESTSIPKLQKPIQPDRDYILSGDLLKLSSRTNPNFINRHCVLTSKEFMYFKNIHSYTANEKALLSVPIPCIQSISHISSQQSENLKNKFQFKIYLKSDNELSRDSSKAFLSRETTLNTSPSVKQSLNPGQVNLRRPLRSSSYQLDYLKSNPTWLTRETNYLSDQKIIFIADSYDEACIWVSEIESLINTV